jgi:hypothetical protein
MIAFLVCLHETTGGIVDQGTSHVAGHSEAGGGAGAVTVGVPRLKIGLSGDGHRELDTLIVQDVQTHYDPQLATLCFYAARTKTQPGSRRNRDAGLSLACPKVIANHETLVSGTSAPGSRIAVYVHPRDGNHEYWLFTADAGAEGSWFSTLRIGNPYGVGHKIPPPLDYDVFATALSGTREAPTAAEFANAVNLGQRLRESAPQLRHCTIHRAPEPAVLCRSEGLRILSPSPAVCPFALGDPTDPGCDPRTMTEVSSPVTFRWEPSIEMFAELYRDGRPVLDVDGQRRGLFSGQERLPAASPAVHLQPGEYEFKIGKNRDAACKASIWFRVTSEVAEADTISRSATHPNVVPAGVPGRQ